MGSSSWHQNPVNKKFNYSANRSSHPTKTANYNFTFETLEFERYLLLPGVKLDVCAAVLPLLLHSYPSEGRSSIQNPVKFVWDVTLLRLANSH
jgi:hypothetical protein